MTEENSAVPIVDRPCLLRYCSEQRPLIAHLASQSEISCSGKLPSSVNPDHELHAELPHSQVWYEPATILASELKVGRPAARITGAVVTLKPERAHLGVVRNGRV